MTPATKIHFGFVDNEDRIVLQVLSDGAENTFLITRRLTRRLIKALAKLLVDSSSVLARTPAPMRKEVIVFEHLSATQSDGHEPANPEEGDGDAPPPTLTLTAERGALLDAVNVEVHPEHFLVSLKADNGATLALGFGRADLHRLLATLHGLSRLADWGLDPECGWLVEAAEPRGELPLASC